MYKGVNILRGLAAFGIVGCHLALNPRTAGAEWLTVFCNFNVAVFAAVSGFLMAAKSANSVEVGWKEYVRKRTGRLMPTYLIWTLIFLVFSMVFQCLASGAIKPKFFTVTYWLQVVFLGGSSTHLWFLISLFYSQVLLYPIMSKMRGSSTLFLGAVVVTVCSCVGGWVWNYPIRLAGFLFVGHGIYGLKKSIGSRLGLVIVWEIVAAASHVALRGVLPGFTRDLLLVVPHLLFFTSISIDETRAWERVSGVLGSTSMGVYLIHPLVAVGLGVFVKKFFPTPFGIAAVLFDWLVVWTVAFVVTLILRRHKLISWIIK